MQSENGELSGRQKGRPAVICRYGNFVVLNLLAFYFFLIPFGLLVYDLGDAGLSGAKIPGFAFRVHRLISGRYERWARQRVASGQGQGLGLEQIAATEWPAFGSVFYLWATEALQETWESQGGLGGAAPKEYAAGAIEAAAALVTDANNAAWVREHWGEDYLHEENVFYRMLLISAMGSYQKLTGDKKYEDFLRDQVETLSAELDASEYGLLDDYPGQCYPTDIVAAIAAIRRADKVLGTDHSEFVRRAVRGFEGKLVDYTGLPPYRAGSRSGFVDISRGCSNQWMTVWAPEIWPQRANKWYENFEEHFWQERWGVAGFREFAKDSSESEWHIDVDSGPVVGGFGAAACGFGVGAARANNRFDHAYALGAEVLALSWPLADGTLLTARLLSNAAHAKYLGEAALLYSFTRMPTDRSVISTGGRLTAFVYWVLGAYLVVGLFLILLNTMTLLRWRRQTLNRPIPLGRLQVGLWVSLIAAGLIVAVWQDLLVGVLLILLGQFLVRGEKRMSRVKRGAKSGPSRRAVGGEGEGG